MAAQELSKDSELVQAASDSLQVHEELCHLMKEKLKDIPQAKKALEESKQLLDGLRLLKSRLEGSHYKFQPPSFSRDILTELRLLSTAFTPATLNDVTKAKICHKLDELFRGQVKRVVFACLLSCPWFAAAQTEVSAKAKNNMLYVVYTASDEQFFSLASPHEIELAETVDEGVVFAAEVQHFCRQLLRGNVRAIEAFCSPDECHVLSTPDWQKLSCLVDPSLLLKKSFLDRALGQAVGAIIKKKKVNDRLVTRDDISLTKFCDSFRLLSHVQCCKDHRGIISWSSSEDEVCSKLPCGVEVMQLLKNGFKGAVHWERLLSLVLACKSDLEDTKPLAEHNSEDGQKVGEWLAAVRLDDVGLSEVAGPPPSDHQRLAKLMENIDVSGIDPAHILVVAEAGSHLYNLTLPTSDTDYIIIYRHPTQRVICSVTHLKESHDNRGRKLDEETGAYEARMFCEMLMKGAVNMVELVFAEELLYMSEPWKQLTKNKELFLSEKVILQYAGYIKTHMKIIKSKKHSGTPRERKIFYSIFHKLLSMEQFAEGKPPLVKCTDERRDYIMRIRRGPLEGDLNPEFLYTSAVERLAQAETQLRARTSRLREFGDYTFLQKWLLSVRGVNLERTTLRMAEPALV